MLKKERKLSINQTAEQLNVDLQNNSTVRQCNLQAYVRDGILVVSGLVHTYYQKQIALYLASKISQKRFQVDAEILVG